MKIRNLFVFTVLLLLTVPMFADPVSVSLLPAGSTYPTGGSFGATFTSNNPKGVSQSGYTPSSGFLLTFGSACSSKFGSAACPSGSYVLGGEAKGNASTPVANYDAPFRLITAGKLTGAETTSPTYTKVGSTYNVTVAGSQNWMLSPGDDSTFYWGNVGCETTNSCLLIATIGLVDVEQVAGTKATVFNDDLTINLAPVGGSLENYFFSVDSPVLQMTLNFASNTSLEKSMGNKISVTSNWSTSANSTGSIVTTPVPEVSSMWVFGAGFAGLAGIVRRRKIR